MSSAKTASRPMTFTSRRLGKFHLTRGWVVGLSVSLLLIAIGFCIAGGLGLVHAKQTKSWPSVPATVYDVERHEHRDHESGRTRYSYISTVHYRVDDNLFEAKFRKRLKNPVTIYFDSVNPDDCVLEPGVESDGTNVAFFVAIFFGLLGAASLAISLSPKAD